MRSSIYGPYDLKRHDNGLVDTSAKAKREFWEKVEADAPGVPQACGCYIFAVKAKRGSLPWYVGLTVKNDFYGEALGPHQVNHYNHALAGKTGVKPQLFLLAKETPQGRFAKPSCNSQRDIAFLETFMFGIAFKRNPKLRNARNMLFLRNLIVPTVVNTPQRPPTLPERAFKATLGL